MDITYIQPFLSWLQEHPILAYCTVFIIAAAESLAVVGILVPGVAFMLGIGVLVGLHALDLYLTLLYAALGAIVGDGASYWLGRHYQQKLHHVWPLSRYPKLILKGERFFHRHGAISVLFGRFIGPVRPIIPAVAGVMGMQPLIFYSINIISALAWAPVVILPGVVFGSSFNVAGSILSKLILMVVLAILFVWSVYTFLQWLFVWFYKNTIFRVCVDVGLKYYRVSAILFVCATIAFASYLRYFNQREEIQWPDSMVQQNSDRQQYCASASCSVLNIHWYGSINSIKTVLKESGLIQSQYLSLANVLLLLQPAKHFYKTPFLQHKLGGQSETMNYIYSAAKSDKILVIRLWCKYPDQVMVENNFCYAQIDEVKLVEYWALLNLPTNMKNYNKSIKDFGSILKNYSESESEVKIFFRVHDTPNYKTIIVK